MADSMSALRQMDSPGSSWRRGRAICLFGRAAHDLGGSPTSQGMAYLSEGNEGKKLSDSFYRAVPVCRCTVISPRSHTPL